MKKILVFLLIFSITLPCFAATSKDISEYLPKAREEGVVFGDETGDFHGDKEATRAEFLAIAERFWGLSGGENIFSDVSEDDWFCKSIAAANFCGIFSGTPDKEAKPYEIIKTEDAVAVIGRYYNATYHKGKYIGVSAYAEEYFGYAFENGLFAGWRNLPNPKQGVTKSEILSLFYRYREKNEQTDCFYTGYPRISSNQQFGTFSIDIMTRTDCDISYATKEKKREGYSWTDFPETQKADERKTIRITAEIGKTYDIYIKAVSKENGRSRISEFKDVAPNSFIRGNGSEDQPYVIYTASQLKQMGIYPEENYILGSDIKVSEEWTPIKNFRGSLNGAGYRIEGITIKDGTQKAGLFGNIEGGTIENLTVDADINVKNIAGIIAGENNEGVIEGCCVTGTVEVSGTSGGGVCGINRGKIKNSLSCAYLVKAGSFAGGIAGQNCSKIENCLSAAEAVTSDMYAGGIAGTNNGGYISGCAAVNIAVYNTMTYNGGKISTNKNDGAMENNYSFADMVSNAAKTEMDADSRNGLELPWESFIDEGFYYEIGWSGSDWKEAKQGFKLVCPKNAAEPVMEKGRTAYYPKKIYSEDELVAIRENGKGYYELARDIKLQSPWKTIDINDGFSGTLDGNGHKIYDLVLNGGQGMFSKINGGTVKNINFENVTAVFNSDGGIVTAVNYGYIENCTISGTVEAEYAKKAGTVAGENNGRIANCLAETVFTVKGKSVTVGGICAVNCGTIGGSAFSGEMVSNSKDAVIGGICGIDKEGYISESAAKLSVKAEGGTSVLGGICGTADNTQIYKCASMGEIKNTGGETVLGGVCGTSSCGTVYNCFSKTQISAKAKGAVLGGICAASDASNIQNTYFFGTVKAEGTNSVAGGICGKAEDSFISQNVSLASAVLADGTANAIVGEGETSDISDNYSRRNMEKGRNSETRGDKNGIEKSDSDLLKPEFYLKPLSENGALGWDETAWTEKEDCMAPILTDTPLMEYAKIPIYR